MKLLILTVFISCGYSICTPVHKQCMDNQPTKIIDGILYNLSDACSANGLTGMDCCWNLQQQVLCSDEADTCATYRKNSNCYLSDNTCVDKDYIAGSCNKFHSQFTCAGGYVDVESRVCTNVVCADNESSTAVKCFNPKAPNPENINDMGSAIAYIQMGQSMSQDMQCAKDNDPSACSLFIGKYFSCYMYAFQAATPGSWNNGGADCMLHHDYFNDAGVPTGYEASDRNLYSQATSGTGNILGNNLNYSLSSDDTKAINNSVNLHFAYNTVLTNQDQNVIYDGDNSKNSHLKIHNSQAISVTINKDVIRDLTGLTAFKNYLADISVNLAWNKQKSEPDPNNIKSITFADEGITRTSIGEPFGWHDTPNYPVINGLCVHFADFCEGGDNDATFSDWIKATFVWAGGFTNPNFCASCTFRDPLFGQCIFAEPRQVLQQWCCFTSKVALDINLAAYDQGFFNIYTGANRYGDQIHHPNGQCGGVTIGMISKIDFSKGNYFSDLMNSIDVNKLVDNSNFTNQNVSNNTQFRANQDASHMVNEWQRKQHAN